MRIVVQRSKEASVTVNGEVSGKIAKGLVLLVGVTHDDTEEDAAFFADKIVISVFLKMIRINEFVLLDVGGNILSVSQFTLYGDCRKGRRPNFMAAAKPDHAIELYQRFNDLLRLKGVHVETGEFGAMMDVQLINDGPVTLLLES